MLRALFVFVALAPAAAMAADTLVVRAQDGTFTPGIAASWKDEAGTVRFTLSPNADPTPIAQTLTDSIAGAQVRTEPHAVLVSGVPLARLLEQVSTINVSDDPLAQIASITMNPTGRGDPEAGGSIRVGKPVLLASLLPHEPAERFEAEVVDVARGEYPSVAVKLRVKSAPKAGPYAKVLTNGKVIGGTVVFTGDKSPNLGAEGNQRNAGAFYVQPKDRVFVHVTDLKGQIATIDWIERAVRK